MAADLPPKHARFVEEYLKDLHAANACIRAGYSAKSAATCGPRLLRNAQIMAAIAQARAVVEVKTGITRERVLRELELITFSDVRHYVFDSDNRRIKLRKGAPKGATRAISSVTFESFTGENGTSTKCKLTLWNKTGVIELAGKQVGLFVDKKESDLPPTEIHIHGDIRPPAPPSPIGPTTTTTGDAK